MVQFFKKDIQGKGRIGNKKKREEHDEVKKTRSSKYFSTDAFIIRSSATYSVY